MEVGYSSRHSVHQEYPLQKSLQKQLGLQSSQDGIENKRNRVSLDPDFVDFVYLKFEPIIIDLNRPNCLVGAGGRDKCHLGRFPV